MSYKYNHGIYIGRFQPVHNAHLESIRLALEDCAQLLIFIGSVKKPSTIKNPWSFGDREYVLKRAILEYFGFDLKPPWSDKPPETILDRITILPVKDYIYSDYTWIADVFSQATAAGVSPRPSCTAVFSSNKDSTNHLFSKWNFVEQLYRDNLDATDIRTSMFEGSLSNFVDSIQPSTMKYLRGWITGSESNLLVDEFFHYRDYKESWTESPFPPTFVTVDTLVLKSGCVLLGRRKLHPGKGLWAMPGGFLKENESLAESAIRELKEETHFSGRTEELIKLVSEVHVFDHPLRSLRGRSITHVHVMNLGFGDLPTVKAGDDFAKARWVPISEFHGMSSVMFEDHWDIITTLISKF